jgi:hypothetical protein
MSSPAPNGQDDKQDFIRRASLSTGLTQDQAILALKGAFTGFRKENEALYMTFLKKLANSYQEAEENPPPSKPSQIPCPFHPESSTVGDIRWYGRHTRTPGWTCRVGGSWCYLRWRTDQILERIGMKKVNWDEWEKRHAAEG